MQPAKRDAIRTLWVSPACLWCASPMTGIASGPGLKRRIVRLLAEPHVGEILLEKGGFDTSILEELRASTDEDGARLITDDMVDSFYLVGSEAQCRERIAQYRDAGVDRPLLLPQLDDYERVATSLGD